MNSKCKDRKKSGEGTLMEIIAKKLSRKNMLLQSVYWVLHIRIHRVVISIYYVCLCHFTLFPVFINNSLYLVFLFTSFLQLAEERREEDEELCLCRFLLIPFFTPSALRIFLLPKSRTLTFCSLAQANLATLFFCIMRLIDVIYVWLACILELLY